MDLRRWLYRWHKQFGVLIPNQGLLGNINSCLLGDRSGWTETALSGTIRFLRSYRGPGTICVTFSHVRIFNVVVTTDGWVFVGLQTEEGPLVIHLFNAGFVLNERADFRVPDDESFQMSGQIQWCPAEGKLWGKAWAPGEELSKQRTLIISA